MKNFFFIIIFIQFSIFGQEQKQNFIIASGSRGGNYYKYASYIAKQYSHKIDENFFVIETNGSNENLKLLKDNSVDFGIVQRNILLSNIYNEENGTKNISVIFPVFQERLLIYYIGDKDLNIRKLDSISKSGNNVIGFTSRKGFSYKIFNKIFKFLNINYSNYKEKIQNYDSLIYNFSRGKINFLVTFSLPIKEMDTIQNVHKIYLSKNDVNLLESRIRNLHRASLGDDKYTLGSWSFLIGTKHSISQINDKQKLLSALLESPIDSTEIEYKNHLENSYGLFTRGNKKLAKLLKDIPVFFPFKRKLGLDAVSWENYFVLFGIFIFLFLFHYYYTGNWFPKYNLLFFWNRYKHFQMGFIALIIIYFLSVEALVYSEEQFYKNIGIKSQILNMTTADLHSWLFVTTVTGNSNGIFPLSLVGKIMLSLNSLNFWIGTILIGISEYFTYKANKKRKKGIMKTNHSNQLVIFGWNGSSEKFILDILDEAKRYNNKKIHIVCVVRNIEKIREENRKIKLLHDNKVIDIIEGDARNFHILERAAVEKAETIILLADDNSRLADEKTLLRAMAISRYVKKAHSGKIYKTTGIKEKVKAVFFEMKKKSKEVTYTRYKIEKTSDNTYMIAEINNQEFKESLIEADVNEIVVAGNYRKAIMKQALFNHGISKVLDEIMQYNEDNEFYKIDLSLPENKHLVGKTFDELLVLLRQEGILLIAIHIIFHDINDNIIIDQLIIEELLKKEEKGIDRDIIVNPVNQIEKNRLTDEDDHLIVLALNSKMIKKGVENIKKSLSNSGNYN